MSSDVVSQGSIPTNGAWNIVSNIREAVIDVGNALQTDLQGFWGERDKEAAPAWHFTHLREQALKHPYIVLVEAVAIIAFTKLAATLTYYLITTAVIGLSGLFLISIISHDPKELLSSLNEPVEGYQISMLARRAWHAAKEWLNDLRSTEESEGLEIVNEKGNEDRATTLVVGSGDADTSVVVESEGRETPPAIEEEGGEITHIREE